MAGLSPELLAGGGGRAGRGLPEMGRGGRPESGRRRRPPVAAAARAAAAAARARGGVRRRRRRRGPSVARGGRRGGGGRRGARGPRGPGSSLPGRWWEAAVADRWRAWSGWRWRRTLSGSARTRPERRIWDFFMVRGERIREFRMGGVYIGLEGARRVQMRCGFWPRDHDRKL